MIHPIFSVLVSRPELVVDHVANYAALLRDESSSVGGEVARRVIAWGVAMLCFIMFLMLAGVALMLGVMHGEFHWVLIVTPCAALAIGVGAFFIARNRLPVKAFTELRAQLAADAQTLRSLGERS